MAGSEREKIHHELLEALYKARKQVEYLEAALAHNAAFLGTGVERDSGIARPAPGDSPLPETVLRYIGLIGPEEDISDYLGRDGHNESRPRLGKDAPEIVRPMTEPRVGQLVGAVAAGHPDDKLPL
ncbi:MAG: hypothetical protein LBN33_01675 [Desulfovibrio sp.]|jgi:hypothetical protein|nr:hypothetical protein [Desulfovibrio sp.]